MKNEFGFNEFVLDYDVVTNKNTSNHQEIIDFLSALGKRPLDEKYELIFPCFYNFRIEKDKLLFSRVAGETYKWLIRNSIKEQVKEHSLYGVGITAKYCSSNIEPSYLEMKLSGSSDGIDVTIVPYRKVAHGQSPCLYTDPISGKMQIETAIEQKTKPWDLGSLIVEGTDSDTKDLIVEHDLKDGIRAHYPIIKDGKRFLYYFFTNNLKLTNAKSCGFGGLFVISKGKLSDSELGFFMLAGYTLANKVAYGQIRQSARNESIKSAKAAIMSRNMSHNLGSHVMVYLKQHLSSVEEMVKKGVLEDLHGKDEKIKDKNLPFLMGLGRFLAYLQERQDYIATVATDYIPYPTVVNFKDAIYDELKPELRYQRHHKEGDPSGLKLSNLLLDYIVFSEGIKSSDRIEIRFNAFNGNGEVPKDLRELNVALPSGIMGRQAFFSIMENIIRNSAKHDGSNIGAFDKLSFSFDILKGEELEKVDFWGDETGGIKQRYMKKRNRYVYFGITTNVNKPKPDKEMDVLLKTVSDGIKADYVLDDGRMDDGFKGIKEMRISAAWMRRCDIDTDIPADEPPALSVRNNGGCLQYVICLPKPKRVAFVYKEKPDTKTVGSKGCAFFFEEDVADSIKIRDIADYEVVVVEDAVGDENYKKTQKNVGARVFKCDKKRMDDFVAQIMGNSCESDLRDGLVRDGFEEVYEEWLRNAFGYESSNDFPYISVLDEQGGAVAETVSGLKLHNSISTSESSSKYYDNCIVFFTHYLGQDKIQQDDRPRFSKALMVEAISGGDSTDRLIRHDERDYAWYAKHVAAGLTQVAVFDERIYAMIMPEAISEEESDEVRKQTEDVMLDFFATHKEKNDNNYEFLEQLLDEKFGIISTDVLNELYNKCMWGDYKDYSEKIIGSTPRKLSNSDADYSKAWKYREKGIWSFNIIAKKGSAQIIGYNAPKEKNIGVYQERYQECIIGTIFPKKDELSRTYDVGIEMEDQMVYDFDFITIHQGILDKIYSALGIKGSELKNKVTQKIFNKFSKFGKQNCDGDFLPQFIIHSGRSKPNHEDMPQHQPFLQFSALDNAVRDCKYTLTELLYSAHYE